MIRKFVDAFMAARPVIEAELRSAHPESYDQMVTRVVTSMASSDEYEAPDASRITVIDHGDYQGTRLYVIGAQGYQPSTYWSIFVNYGSCSGCDTYERIREYSDEPPNDQQVSDYWMLMLHMAQSMRELRNDPVDEAA